MKNYGKKEGLKINSCSKHVCLFFKDINHSLLIRAANFQDDSVLGDWVSWCHIGNS